MAAYAHRNIAIILTVAIVLSIFLIKIESDSDKKFINEWARNQDSQIELRVWSKGPFWYAGKGDRVYLVTVSSGKKYWFRFSFWKPDIKEY